MSKELETLCINRIKRCWEWLCDSSLVPGAANNVDGKQYFLDPYLVAETAVQYSSDCDILKIRYGEKSRIQPPRVAGLMANSISKYKPISIREGFLRSPRVPLNELLAIFNGLFICSEFPAKNKKWGLIETIQQRV